MSILAVLHDTWNDVMSRSLSVVHKLWWFTYDWCIMQRHSLQTNYSSLLYTPHGSSKQVVYLTVRQHTMLFFFLLVVYFFFFAHLGPWVAAHTWYKYCHNVLYYYQHNSEITLKVSQANLITVIQSTCTTLVCHCVHLWCHCVHLWHHNS